VSVDCDRVQVYRKNDGRTRNTLRSIMMFFSLGRSITLGNNIFLGRDGIQEAQLGGVSVLAHEMTHVSSINRGERQSTTREGSAKASKNSEVC
jgi:hypothetical protein